MPGIENFLVHYVQHHLDRKNPAMSVCEYDGFTRKDEELFLDMEATRLIVQDNDQVIITGGPEVQAALAKVANFK
ncbi:hypothetical protein Sste5346_006079 [Sporothrix stenoceras]|uniref:Uncharacterized protein n=1 Tax=Sporothrix stenoceras TaxID=5173 RepID=A0ABR3Z1M2_9PEZI